MKYTYPNGFDLARAEELGSLVGAAYDQLDQRATWQAPAGYTILATLLAKETWNAPGTLSGLLAHLIPQVPFGFVASKNGDAYVVIRGTKTPLEWLDDFTAQPVAFEPAGQAWGKTTLGFKMLYDEISPEIGSALESLGGGLQSVYVTGHSLGAALAHLVVAGITAKFGVKPISYTFSGPRAGDPGFASAFEAAELQTWRIFNTEDIVPTVAPAAVQMVSPNMGMHGFGAITQSLIRLVQLSPVGYQHVGYPIAATFHSDTIPGNHSLGDLCAEIAKA